MGKMEAAPTVREARRFSGLSLALVGILAVVAGGATVLLLRTSTRAAHLSPPQRPIIAVAIPTKNPIPIPAPAAVEPKQESTERAIANSAVPIAAVEVSSALEITSFGTRLSSTGNYRECFGEVKNNGSTVARFVKVAIRCSDRGQIYLDSTYVEPNPLPSGDSGTFKTYVSAPQGTGWTAEVEGSGKQVASTESGPAPLTPSPATIPAGTDIPPPTAVFGVDKFRWWYTECCAVVAGTVYNRGMAAGHAQVTIVGRDMHDSIVETKTVSVDPYEVPPKSVGNFEHSFFSTAAVKWEVEIVEKIPSR